MALDKCGIVFHECMDRADKLHRAAPSRTNSVIDALAACARANVLCEVPRAIEAGEAFEYVARHARKFCRCE